MAYTDINSEQRLVQTTFAEHLEKKFGWSSERDVVLVRDLRAALDSLNPQLQLYDLSFGQTCLGGVTHDY